MIFTNDRILKDMSAALFRRFGKEGLIEKIDELEARLEAVEKPKLGRPRKIANG